MIMKKRSGYKVVIKILDGISEIFLKLCQEDYDDEIMLQCDKIITAINRLRGIIKRKVRIKEK